MNTCWLCGRPIEDHKITPFGPICPKKEKPKKVKV